MNVIHISNSRKAGEWAGTFVKLERKKATFSSPGSTQQHRAKAKFRKVWSGSCPKTRWHLPPCSSAKVGSMQWLFFRTETLSKLAWLSLYCLSGVYLIIYSPQLWKRPSYIFAGGLSFSRGGDQAFLKDFQGSKNRALFGFLEKKLWSEKLHDKLLPPTNVYGYHRYESISVCIANRIILSCYISYVNSFTKKLCNAWMTFRQPDMFRALGHFIFKCRLWPNMMCYKHLWVLGPGASPPKFERRGQQRGVRRRYEGADASRRAATTGSC